MLKYPEPKSFGPFQKFRERLRERGKAGLMRLPFLNERKTKRRKKQQGRLQGDTLYLPVEEWKALRDPRPADRVGDVGSIKARVPSRLGGGPAEIEVPALGMETGIVGIKGRRKNPERRRKGRNES